MKLNQVIRSLFLGAALSAGSLMANTVKIYNTDFDGIIPNGGGGGGEFRAVDQSGVFGEFYTFCLESSVGVALPGTYNYTIDNAALNQGDVLSVGSAWLYEMFFFGNLSGPTPATNYSDNRDFNAGLLQKAFWFLENEGGGVNNYYVGLAVAHFGTLAGAKANIAADSKVKVMNLWTVNGGADVQSQLVYVPDAGMTAALLGLGLLGLAAFRRKN